jgi:hypothetical protein
LAPTAASADPPEHRQPPAYLDSLRDVERIRGEIHALEAKDRANRQAAFAALCRQRGDLRVGLDYEGVRRSCWGTLKPRYVNTTVTAGHRHEQWVYGTNSYVYFTDGIVTSYQQFVRQ